MRRIARSSSIRSAGVETAVYDRTVAELPTVCIDECVAVGRGFGPDAVIGIGGGSCLDIAKLTALMLTHGGRLQDYYGELLIPGPVIPVIAVPTTSGTGSEGGHGRPIISNDPPPPRPSGSQSMRAAEVTLGSAAILLRSCE